MTQEDDPRPLKSSGDAPEELVRALSALRRDRDAERLARVAGKLSASVGASGAGSSGISGLLGGKGGLVAIALGVGALATLGYSLFAGRALPSTQLSAKAPVQAPAATNTSPQRALAT
jgi:hypothetical protein